MEEMFKPFEEKMRAAGMGDAAIGAFRRYYGMWLRDENGLIPEADIEPATDLPALDALDESQAELFAQAVVIKLNGGLGTGMGLKGPKSTLPVREGANFLDLMVKQILDLREQSNSKVRLLLMNSFSTSEETLAHLSKYKEHGLASADEVEMMQNQIPKIDAQTKAPAKSETDPSLEWCPPGHGDLYPALLGSGWLDRLLDEGIRYAFVSNSDNLGAVMDADILTYFAKSGAPFLLEVTRRTEADRKGGHLAIRKSDGRLLLREVAQCPDEDLDSFQNIDRHQYFNTNSLWLRLDVLKEQLEANDGVLPLPMITNRKTLDPRDKTSTPVVQLECAMGAAIECFEGAQAIEVPRSRFAPVKTTSDLFALRSDAYEVLDNGRVRLQASRKGKPPVVNLADCYKLVDSIAALEIPSLIDCERLEIKGPVEFEPGVKFSGKVVIEAMPEGVKKVAAGEYSDETV
ncbi:MAG: UTP--glucose-1-phosphate uridylyltransferase [Akkermansiaceae bacterium]|nr:UTP--glucose-1-phosphate uridylyltransferase [Akkermansiaceae bacterium]